MHKDKGFTLIELMIVIAIIAIIAAIAIPGLLNSIRGSNERNASGSLKTIATAEADMRSNDRDSNRVNDFWTGDLAGLYAIDNSSVAAGAPTAIKLVEVSLALADMANASGVPAVNYSFNISTFGVISAKAGYWYRALVTDLQVVANGGNGTYAQDTGDGDLVHNTSRFGACAQPESYGSSGNRVFIINEGNTIFVRDFGQDTLVAGIPPTQAAVGTLPDWPTDAEIALSWGKMD